MLAEEGGSAAEAEIEPGGWVKASRRTGSVFTDVAGGWMQVHAVNRSPVTKRVVSVKVMGLVGYRDPKPGLVSINVERLGEDAYRAPTDEERQAFQAATKAAKAAAKAAKPKAAPLVNPTDEDAERLQAILNELGRVKHEAKWAAEWERKHYPYVPTPVLRMTQAKYSELSKGSYSSYETKSLHNGGGMISRRPSNLASSEGYAYDQQLGPAVAKLRMRYPHHQGSQWFNPPHVVVLTDKPQKPLPMDWAAVESKEEVAA